MPAPENGSASGEEPPRNRVRNSRNAGPMTGPRLLSYSEMPEPLPAAGTLPRVVPGADAPVFLAHVLTPILKRFFDQCHELVRDSTIDDAVVVAQREMDHRTNCN